MLDLDELVLLCRDEQARKYISEAVAAYKAGAFRACVISTWIAVVYDYLHKLHELELTRDKPARDELILFEDIRVKKDLPRSLKFEKEILNKAKEKFELISHLEYDDLNRLYEDRNRYAYPSMLSSEEIYQLPPELARYHLRNVVTHLLQHQPVQGRAALSKLTTDVDSNYFTNDWQTAIDQFGSGPLARSRPALIKDFTYFLLKGLFIDDLNTKKDRYMAAFKAVKQLHRDEVENTIAIKLN